MLQSQKIVPLKSQIDKLMALGKEAVSLSDSCKFAEPMLTITWDNEGKVFCEFYSYCLNLFDGGRHHYFELKDIGKIICKAQEELKEMRKNNKEELCQNN